MNPQPKANGPVQPFERPPGSREIRWQDLPRPIQMVLDRTPHAHWYKIRPVLALCPETNKVLDLARFVDQVFPRSSYGIRQRGLSMEERLRKAQELLEAYEEFWSGVGRIEAVLEKIARVCGFWAYIDPRRKRPEPVKKSPPLPPPRPAKPDPQPPPAFQAQEMAESEGSEQEDDVS